MCLNPTKIRVKSKFFSINNYQPLYIEVPCGKCSECMELKRDQWYLRNYWHSKECLDRGGYVFFETLSYRDSDLPHLSDWFEELEGDADNYSCFNYEHYRNFMKRLRINLTRGAFEEEYIQKNRLINLRKRCKKGTRMYEDLTAQIDDLDAQVTRYTAARNINAFCVCEYGSDKYYQDDNGRMRKATFRPHYHLLFYVNVPGLDSCTLAKYIYKSWTHGKTDSYDIYGNLQESYVKYHNTIGLNYKRNTDLDLRKISKYVAKYITKESSYSDKLRKRVASVTSKLFCEDIDGLQDRIDEFRKTGIPQKNYGVYGMYDRQTQNKIYRDVCRLIDGFHLQGQGFGLYALDPMNFDENELLTKGTFKLPDSKIGVKHIPAPMYYIRKLYYDVITPRENYLIDSPVFILKTSGYDYKRKCLYRSLDNSVRKYSNLYLNMSKELKDKVDSFLHGRKIDEFCIYKLFYKGRVAPDEGVDFNYNHVIEKIVCNKPLVSKEVFRDNDGDCWIFKLTIPRWWFSFNSDDDYDGYYYQSFDEFVQGSIIDERYYEFRDFDKLDSLFNEFYNEFKSVPKQEVFDHKENLIKKYEQMRNF